MPPYTLIFSFLIVHILIRFDPRSDVQPFFQLEILPEIGMEIHLNKSAFVSRTVVDVAVIQFKIQRIAALLKRIPRIQHRRKGKIVLSVKRKPHHRPFILSQQEPRQPRQQEQKCDAPPHNHKLGRNLEFAVGTCGF
ncbi:MAG: hypothetical protein IPN95_18470 [Bacteroidetes bacterium]|nr:hypothetical protein [Bacteroidota bacterium]